MLRRLKHELQIALMKIFVALAPGAQYNLFSGENSSQQLCRYIARNGAKRVLVVSDKPLVELGIVQQVLDGFAGSDVQTFIYDGVQPDPTYQIVAEGAAMYRRENCDAILAIGGGSSIDAAKVLGASAMNPEDNPKDYIGYGKFKTPLPPFFAVPTTAGTGSEATSGAVITDESTHVKSVLADASMLPRAAALDPLLFTGLPASITAATGMDALTHAIESYIGTWERKGSAEKGLMAVKAIFANLETACKDGGNVEARDAMAHASYTAGQAINLVNVGNVHAIAHQVGATYGVPHGLANAMILPHVLTMSLSGAREKLTELANHVGLKTAEEFIDAVVQLNQSIGIPESLEKLDRKDFPRLIECALAEADGYPVPHFMVEEDVEGILQNLLP